MLAVIAPWANMDRVLTEMVANDLYILGRHSPLVLSVYAGDTPRKDHSLVRAGILLLLADEGLPLCSIKPAPNESKERP
jgi:hypothetical protein